MKIQMPKLLYHGTNVDFYDAQVKRFGRYQQDESMINLDSDPLIPLLHAVRRASFYNSIPLVLLVNTSRVTSSIKPYDGSEEGWYLCDFLDQDSHAQLPLLMKKEQTDIIAPSSMELIVGKFLSGIGSYYINSQA